jgi:GST-like protein
MTIELYAWDTPNGRKISVALEEMQLDYTVHPVNITKGEQQEPAFVSIAPNGKIPAIVDTAGPDGRRVPYCSISARKPASSIQPVSSSASLFWNG